MHAVIEQIRLIQELRPTLIQQIAKLGELDRTHRLNDICDCTEKLSLAVSMAKENIKRTGRPF